MTINNDQQFQRPKEGFRFRFGGIKTNAPADACPPDKYPFALNIRSTQETSVRTRNGLTKIAATVDSAAITDVHSYAQLNTDNLPRYLFRAANDKIWLAEAGVTQSLVGTLLGSGVSPGASMIPFRPAESPTPYMYVANGSDYQKFSAPNGADVVVQANAGIAEPQSSPEAFLFGQVPTFIDLGAGVPVFTNAGTAGALSNVARVTDTSGVFRGDPARSPATNGSMQVGNATAYQRWMKLLIGGLSYLVNDVYAPLVSAITVQSIYYFTGTTGRCVVVPNNLTTSPGTDGQSVYAAALLEGLRRGSLIKFSSGAEICYVWSVTVGPDGSVAIETSTTGTHAAGETLTGVPAVQVVGSGTFAVQALTSPAYQSSVTAGIGTLTTTLATNPFVLNGFSYQPDDYVHFSVNVDDLTKLNEIKLLIDVGDGSFTQNFYFYAIRPADIVAGVANTLTQLGAAQLVTQRAIIDEENAAAARNQGQTYSSAQTSPGSSQWSEILFPISALTRVGNDQTKSLLNAGKLQLLVNASATVVVQFNSFEVFGGYQPDVGQNGAPYLYRVRPRSSVTGVKGNPSPATRYGLSPRRGSVAIAPPSASYDPQIDTWDIFRYGGTLTSWRKIGQVDSSTVSVFAPFFDNYSDLAAAEGEELEFDNYEPWPTINIPFSGTMDSVTGFTAIMFIVNSLKPVVISWLPGNLIRLGGANVYTLRVRPVVVSSTFLVTKIRLEFIENAGQGTLVPFQIQEPALARQTMAYMWGPDAAGTVFAVGDNLRPGTVSFSKNYAPDAAPDKYNIEITDPSEPLLGGEILDGLSFVASSERWWALYPQNNPAQRYSVIQQPIDRGLAAPYGHCSDGRSLYWWAKDSIRSSTMGSLTDADLYNLFPHDGVPGSDYTYNGRVIHAPDYSRAGTFRLAYCNYYLYATYQGTDGIAYTLVLDTRRGAWCPDLYSVGPPSVFYHPNQQAGTLQSSASVYPLLVAGGTDGGLYQSSATISDAGAAIAASLATMEFDGGDVRSGEQWGDLWLDVVPVSGITVTPMSFGAPAPGVPVTSIPGLGAPFGATPRVQTPVSLGGEYTSDFLGLLLEWSDNGVYPTVLQIWQPSFLVRPEMSQDRFTDWFDGGTEQAKFVQGFLLHADTDNAPKAIAIRDSDTLTTHPFNVSPILHNGESILAYSFVTPFIAHLLRIEPLDMVPWRMFSFDIVYEPTPESAENWITQGTAFGLTGYMHLKQVSPCYAASQPITLTIRSYDGQSPATVTLPATAGAMQKLTIILTANKGSLYFFSATSAAPFQLFLDSWEIMVGGWARQDNYLRYRSLGGETGDQARV